LDASTGTKLWSFATGGCANSPAVANGVVYVGSCDGNVYALDASTGVRLWSFMTGGGTYSPIVADGMVFVSSGDGNIYAFGLPADS
jgi:outer membrane protein assembly factor BamB